MIKKETVLKLINDLINENRIAPGDVTQSSSYQLGYFQALTHIKRYVDALHDEDNWIPVEERLPEDVGVYIVDVVTGTGEHEIVTWMFCEGKHLSGHQHYVDDKHYWASNYGGEPINEFLSNRVIAWQPMPGKYVKCN